jgi:DNA polymerase III subunit delta
MPSPTPVVYAFYGQDQPTLKERLDDLVGKSTDPASADLNISKLDGRSVTSGEIESAARSLPFLGETRVVIVENLTDSASGRAVIDTLGELVPTLPDSTRLIFLETNAASEDVDGGGSKRGAGRAQALKKLVNVIESDPRGTVIACEPPQDIARWLQDRAKRHNATLEGGGAKVLAERIGGDLVMADSELAKLATYAAGRAISVEDVKTLTPASTEANVFQMVDALGQRRGQPALAALRALLDSGDEPLRIFGMIARQIRLLIQMREQLDAGASVNAAAQALNQRDFVAKKLAEQARQYKMETLERILSLLLEMDVDIKTGQIEGELALEELVVRLAGRG